MIAVLDADAERPVPFEAEHPEEARILMSVVRQTGIAARLFRWDMNHAMYAERLQLGRNELCWCGSGVKYKKCCLARHRG